MLSKHKLSDELSILATRPSLPLPEMGSLLWQEKDPKEKCRFGLLMFLQGQ